MKKLLLGSLLAVIFAGAGLARADVGEVVYTRRCATCHGFDGHGGTPISKKIVLKDLTRTALATADIEQAIRDGRPARKMPGYRAKIPAEAIAATALYVKTSLR